MSKNHWGHAFCILCAAVALFNNAQAVSSDDCTPYWDIAIGQPGMERGVRCMTVFDDGAGGGSALYAGGQFASAGGVTVNHIARWNGAVWEALTSGEHIGVPGSVQALTVYNGNLIVGGMFTTAGGQTVNHIARWDGSSWHPFISGGQIGIGGGFGYVSALTVWNGDLVAAGSFTTVGGQTVNHIARWDGEQWHPFASGGQIGVFSISTAVVALAVWNGQLIAAGGFTTAGGQTVNRIARWDGSAWHPFTSGGQIGVGPLHQPVYALVVWNGDLIVGGSFHTAGGQTVNQIARWDGTSWHPFLAGGQIGMGGTEGWVLALTNWNEDLVAGGVFITAGGQSVFGIARWDGMGWHPFVSGGQNGVVFGVWSVAVHNDDLVVGGDFTTAGGQAVNRIAIWKECHQQPPPTGACCFNDGSCSECTATECNALGGIYHGDLVACDDVVCEAFPRGPEGSVILIIGRIDYFYRPADKFLFEVIIDLTGDIESVWLTLPGGAKIELNTYDDDGTWSKEFSFQTFSALQAFAHGTSTIEIFTGNGESSTSTFTLNANAIQESDIFPNATVISPQQDAVNVSPCPVFLWTDPTGKAEADVLAVGVVDEHFTFEQEAVSLFGEISVNATSWQAPLPVLPGINEFGVFYVMIDEAGLVSELAITSGDITWGVAPWAPSGYPASTPVLLLGSDTIISFHVANESCISGDLNNDGHVDVLDLLILLGAWGVCPPFEPCLADLNGTNTVDVQDLLILLANWG